MPIYEFSCNSCGHHFEEIVPSDDPAPACPACGSQATQKILSTPSPLKKGAFPFKPQPPRMMPGAMSQCGQCGGKGTCGNG